MFSLIGWAIYGTIVGLLAKAIAKFFVKVDDDFAGWIGTIVVGIVGAYVGGGINLLLGNTNSFAPAGMVWGVVGGVVATALYYTYLNKE